MWACASSAGYCQRFQLLIQGAYQRSQMCVLGRLRSVLEFLGCSWRSLEASGTVQERSKSFPERSRRRSQRLQDASKTAPDGFQGVLRTSWNRFGSILLENLIFDRCMKRNHCFCSSRGPPKPAWRVLGSILETSWRLLENLGGVLDASWKHLESNDVFLGFPWLSREAWVKKLAKYVIHSSIFKKSVEKRWYIRKFEILDKKS